MFRMVKGLQWLIVFCCTTLATTCFAQFGASVQGTTQDAAGATLPGVGVTLLNKDTQVTQKSTSNSEGTYRFNSLAPGNYTVTAAASGFTTATTNFILQTNEQRNVPFSLGVGQVLSTVDVTLQAPLLDTSDSRNQQTLDTKALEELPVAARNPLSLITLTPGVVGKGSSNATNFNSENYTDASANGRGSNGNQYIVDGLDATSNARAGVTNLTPNVDALSETTVQVNRYDVDFARSSSIQTVMTTKAGTQQFHGFGSIYYTWQALYAKSEFTHPAPGQPMYPPFHVANLSFGVGGPILPKQKLLFFASIEPYKSITSNVGALQTYEDQAFVAFARQVRPTSFGTAVLSKYAPANFTTFSTQTAAQVFGASKPASNSGCQTPSTLNIPCNTIVLDSGTFNAQNYNNSKQYNIRIDKYFSKDRLYGTIFRTTQAFGTATLRPAFFNTNGQYGKTFQVNETHDFSAKTLNEASFAFLRIEGSNGLTGLFTVPVINVTGLGTGFGGAPGDFVQHNYRWRDVLSHVIRSHSLKVGYEASHVKQESFFAPGGMTPNFSYTNLINLINDNPLTESSLSYDELTAKPSPSQNFYALDSSGFFAEDAWQVNRRITLNYGLRYDNFGNAYPVQGTKLANFYLGTGATLTGQVASGFLKAQDHYFQHDLNWIFSPRVGVAADPFGNGKYVVRGGFGIYHDYFNINNAVGGAKTNPPSYIQPTFFNNGSTAAPILGFGTQNTAPFGFQYPAFIPKTLDAKGGIVGSQISIGGSDQNLKPETTLVYSGGIERQLGRNMVASVTYVGTHSYNLWTGGVNPNSTNFGQDINVVAGDLINHLVCKGAVGAQTCTGVTTRPNTSFGSITYTLNAARQNYSALIVAVKGRFTQRGFLTASYTRSTDEDNAFNYPTSDFNRYYGPSIYDIPQRLSLGTSYQLPGLHHDNGFVGRLTGGYTASGIVALQSGNPFSVAITNAYSATAANPALPASPTNLAFTPNSGDYNADGRNFDFPNVSSYTQKTDRSSYITGIFPQCSGGNFNNCGPFSQPAMGQEGNEKSNGFRNPGFAQTDLTIEKITKIRESVDFRLRVDAFNAFNRVNLNAFSSNANDGNFGRATSTSTPRFLLLGARINF